jgi:hypothetical protein
MNRRDLLLSGAGLLGLALIPRAAHAALACAEDPVTHITTCAFGVRTHVMDGVYASQENTMWCWAACLHMMFKYYGYPVSQARIVSEGWGSVVNLPALAEQVIAATNRSWVSDDGRSFRVFGKVFGVKLADVAADLAKGAPLIVASQGHAMLLSKVVFTRDPYGNEQLQSATVRDPWPGRGERSLSPAEWASAVFLLRVTVWDANGAQVTRAPSACQQEVVACSHPGHPQGDLVPCQHACQGSSGPVPCHTGDLVPCQHVCQGPAGPIACHSSGDMAPCGHPMHPQGDAVYVCR